MHVGAYKCKHTSETHFSSFNRYPAPLMVRIAELSKDVAKEYREIKKTKLQRTFVTASNAAESKATRMF